MVKLWGSLVDPRKKALINTPAPPGYIAGLGRGATAFTTRSDIGPAISNTDDPLALVNLQRSANNNINNDNDNNELNNENEKNFDKFNGFLSENLFANDPYDAEDEEADAIYDEISRKMSERRFKKRVSDNIHKDSIDKSKSKSSESKLGNINDNKNNNNNNNDIINNANTNVNKNNNNSSSRNNDNMILSEKFKDLKSDLQSLTQEDWLGIPEVSDWRNRAKRQKEMALNQRLAPIPDSVLLKTINDNNAILPRLDSRVQNEDINNKINNVNNDNNNNNNINDVLQSNNRRKQRIDLNNNMSTNDNNNNNINSTINNNFGTMSNTPYGTSSSTLGFMTSNQSRNKLLDIRLNEVSDSVSGQTVVDPTGYLTSLKSTLPQYYGTIDDVVKAKLLLKSVISTNPHHAPAWIAAARLEEITGKHQSALYLIMQGLNEIKNNNNNNYQSEDIWLEAIRLANSSDKEKLRLCKMATLAMPKSVKLWLKGIELQRDNIAAKKRVVRQALEHVPMSVKLWKVAVDLEADNDDKEESINAARLLLRKAVECCHSSVDLWLALARLEPYEEARKVLNQARQQIPTDRQIWISASKLEESQNNKDSTMIEKILKRALQSLAANSVEIKREEWLADAAVAEKGNFLLTAKQIIKEVFKIGINPKEIISNSHKDVEFFKSKKALHCARFIYLLVLSEMPRKASIYLSLANLEKDHSLIDENETTLYKAVLNCPKAEIFWLMLAKSRWQKRNVEDSRKILEQAFRTIPDSEEIWLAAAKIELESKAIERAELILANALTHVKTPRIYMKSAHLQRCKSNYDQALALIDEALSKFRRFPKLYMMKAQILIDQNNDLNEARKVYNDALKLNANCLTLWLLLAEIEVKSNAIDRARSVLERAKLRFSHNEILWKRIIDLEISQNQFEFAKQLTNRALQLNPKSGRLWSLQFKINEKSEANIGEIIKITNKNNNNNNNNKNDNDYNGNNSSANKNIKINNTALSEHDDSHNSNTITVNDNNDNNNISLNSNNNQILRQLLLQAISNCEEDVQGIILVAKYFLKRCKWKKCQEWLEKALLADSDCGDVWIVYLAFLMKIDYNNDNDDKTNNNDTKKNRRKTAIKNFFKRFIKSDPKHGDIWCSYSKNVKYWLLAKEEILKIAANDFLNHNLD